MEVFWEKNLSLLNFASGETAETELLSLFSGWFLFGRAFDLGFFSHNFVFLRLTCRRNKSFSASWVHHAR